MAMIQTFQLIHRSAKPIYTITRFLNAILDSCILSRLQSLEFQHLADESFCRSGFIKAHGQSRFHQLQLIVFNGLCVTGKGSNAYIGKSSGFTRAFYETVGGCGVSRRAGEVGKREEKCCEK
uniref:Uncharacterized protein n=1 Tax=Solanum lycopersicum TaxID=4081 RepID=A0A3Q7FKU5_SOLLC